MKFITLLVLGFCISFNAQAVDLVMYTDRTMDVMGPLALSFEQKTGHKLIIIPFTDTNELLGRVAMDVTMGNQLDAVYIKDIVFLSELAKNKWLVPLESPTIEANIPAHLRAPDKTWTALTYRARTIVYNSLLATEKFEFDIDTINTYADLAKPELLDNICVRTSEHSYNQTLIAELITKYGYEPAKEMVAGWVANFAEGYPTTEGDAIILKKIVNGDCQIAVVNSYYLGQALAAKAPYKLSIKFLNQADGGVMINGTSAGVIVTTKEKAAAQELIEFMTGTTAQTALSNEHKDFPANPNAKQAPILDTFPKFEANKTNWSEFFLNLDAAKTLATEVGYK